MRWGLSPRRDLDIKPLTVFVGRQGTGKSLVSQVLYFFEELPYLANFVRASSRDEIPPQEVVRRILDQLRSSDRSFAAFACPRVTIEWTRSLGYRFGDTRFPGTFRFSAYSVNRVVNPNPALRDFVTTVLGSRASVEFRRAVFFPTERLVISQLRSAIAE